MYRPHADKSPFQRGICCLLLRIQEGKILNFESVETCFLFRHSDLIEFDLGSSAAQVRRLYLPYTAGINGIEYGNTGALMGDNPTSLSSISIDIDI
jgi:hypothetical protein